MREEGSDRVSSLAACPETRKQENSFKGDRDMRRYFNTEGQCDPEIHYMVRLDERLRKIRQSFVDRGKYFIINRGRQYGKTTTLMALAEYLREDYIVLAMDFQLLGSANFNSEQTFVTSFIECLEDIFDEQDVLADKIDQETVQDMIFLKKLEDRTLDKLFRCLAGCAGQRNSRLF